MTTKIHFLVMLLTVLSLAANATDKKDAEKKTAFEVVRQGNVFKLFYLKKDISKVNVKIVDKSGRVVFTERIRNEEGFIRPYNFKDLDHGDYQIIVSVNEQILVKTVHHGELEVEEETAILRLVKLDQIKGKKRLFKLTIVNQGDAKAAIKVKNENEEVIFSITESFSGNYSKLYNLSQLGRNTSLEVTLDGEVTNFEL